VALKKPADFFGKNKNDFDKIKDNVSLEKIETVSEAFSAFKTNLNHIQSISDFSLTVENFKENVDKVESISKEISEVKEDIRGLINKDDLDEAMVAHLLFVEESIKKIEGRIKSVNGDTIDKIKEDFTNLSQTVENFVDVDIPSYKKLVSESEIRFDARFSNFKGLVEEDLDGIREDVNREVNTVFADVETVNENIVSDLKRDLKRTTKDVNETVSNLVNEEFPKYKKLFAETELKTEQRVSAYDDAIEKLNLMVKEFTENEIPKYSNLLVETKLKSEKEVKELENNVLEQVQSLKERVELLSEDVIEKTSDIDSLVEEKIRELQLTIDDSKQRIGDISDVYMALYKDFKDREIHENKKLEEYSGELIKFSNKFSFFEETLAEDVRELQNVLDISTTKYYDVLKNEVGEFEENMSNQIKDLELNLVVNEKHIKKQNENIESIKEEVKDVIERLQINSIEEKNKSLSEKVVYIEKILTEFNEKALLKEDNPTLPGDASTKNSADPLTPLDQNFVTIDQLQSHYKLFINRIQQQIATIGGGGAGFIKDLDDVTFDQTTGTNQLLIYNGAKWVGIASTSISGESKLVDLTDVDASNVGDGRFLRYDASAQEFTFAPVSATNLELIAGDIQSGILTTTSTSAAVVMSISASTYRSANYQVQVTRGSNYNMTTVNVIHDGTITYMTEYGTINQPIGVATFSSDISSGALRLIGHPTFSSETTFKVIFSALQV
jgi:phosphopantetheine adenylyltransferase